MPVPASPTLPPDWLRVEMLERHLVLQHLEIMPGTTVIEVGSGPHAIATVPLAHAVGGSGRVIAVERARWQHFAPIVSAGGVRPRVRPIAADARWLPLRDNAAALAACIHGLRSLGEDGAVVAVLREMFRVADRVAIAESLPRAVTGAQRAHLAMYDLRAEVFSARTGRSDDLRYRELSRLIRLIEEAGGRPLASKVLGVDLPHALAYFPRRTVEEVPDETVRPGLLRRWDDAEALGRRDGTDHPPVGIVLAQRSGSVARDVRPSSSGPWASRPEREGRRGDREVRGSS